MEPLPRSSPHLRRNGLLLASMLLPLLLSSCFTMALWGFLPDTDTDPVSGSDEATFTYDPQTKWSWSMFLLRVALTPVTLGLDCVTCPVQAVLFDSDDHKHCRCRH
jgi:hypothetical protein